MPSPLAASLNFLSVCGFNWLGYRRVAVYIVLASLRFRLRSALRYRYVRIAAFRSPLSLRASGCPLQLRLLARFAACSVGVSEPAV
jgi:hypothetical protein